VCQRILRADRSVPLTYFIFDVLRVNGVDVKHEPCKRRRQRLEEPGLDGVRWTTASVFDDGEALWGTVCERGLEGVVAKKLTSRYRSGEAAGLSSRTRRTGAATQKAVARSAERPVRTGV
jgi:ATP-dependent DNA ligase